MKMAGRFFGKVLEAGSGKPVEYASIQLIQNKFDSVSKKRKDVIVSGMLTKANGEFSLENIPVSGQFKLFITGIGYKAINQTVAFDLKMGGGNTNMGNSEQSSMLTALDKDLGATISDIFPDS